MEEEQDYEKPLKDLEGEQSGMDERVEEVGKDVSERRSEWEGKQGDSAVPGAQDPELLKEDYGAHEETGDDESEPAEAEDSSASEEEGEDSESESRGEGAVEEEEDFESESRGEGAEEEDEE